jgi:uridine kinase
VRYERGSDSPEGFYRDSFDLHTLKRELLDPLSPDGSGTYRTACFDHVNDRRVESEVNVVRPPAVLLFDGVFLHRPELCGYWDYSIFLDVDPAESVRRCVARSGRHDLSLDPADPVHRRYVQGQALYLAECHPQECATLVVDNGDVDAPFIAA